MAIYLVTWDLNDEVNYRRSRDVLIERLDRLENTLDSGLRSVRFVSTTSSAEQLRDYLIGALDKTDRIFVTRLRADECAWYMNTDVRDWINTRITL